MVFTASHNIINIKNRSNILSCALKIIKFVVSSMIGINNILDDGKRMNCV